MINQIGRETGFDDQKSYYQFIINLTLFDYFTKDKKAVELNNYPFYDPGKKVGY